MSTLRNNKSVTDEGGGGGRKCFNERLIAIKDEGKLNNKLYFLTINIHYAIL